VLRPSISITAAGPAKRTGAPNNFIMKFTEKFVPRLEHANAPTVRQAKIVRRDDAME
jgi:hypothetical protein